MFRQARLSLQLQRDFARRTQAHFAAHAATEQRMLEDEQRGRP